jgi:hypothetical protein
MAVSRGAGDAAAARAFVALYAGPDAAETIRAKGMLPAR